MFVLSKVGLTFEKTAELHQVWSQIISIIQCNFNNNGCLSDINGLRYSFNPEKWRTWSSQRAGFTETEFEGFCFQFQNVFLSAMFSLNNV